MFGINLTVLKNTIKTALWCRSGPLECLSFPATPIENFVVEGTRSDARGVWRAWVPGVAHFPRGQPWSSLLAPTRLPTGLTALGRQHTSNKACSAAGCPEPRREVPRMSTAPYLAATVAGIPARSFSVHSTDAGHRGVPASRRSFLLCWTISAPHFENIPGAEHPPALYQQFWEHSWLQQVDVNFLSFVFFQWWSNLWLELSRWDEKLGCRTLTSALVCSLVSIDSVKICWRCHSEKRSSSEWRATWALTSPVRHSLPTKARWCQLCGTSYPGSLPSGTVPGFLQCNQLTTSFRSVTDPEPESPGQASPGLLPLRN